MKRWLALFLLLSFCAHAQTVVQNPLPGWVWTYNGPTFGADWAPPVSLGTTTSIVGGIPLFNNTTGTALIDSTQTNTQGLANRINVGDRSGWLETFEPPSLSLAQLSSVCTNVQSPTVGCSAVLGGARTSDFGAVSNVYGAAGIAVNDKASSTAVAWGGLFQAVRTNTNAGASLGIEVNGTNAVNNIVDVRPFTPFPFSGITAGLWIAPSPCSFLAPSGICAAPTFNPSVAIGIVGNGSTLITVTTHNTTTLDGIADTSNITVGGPVNGECVPAGTIVLSKTANSVLVSNTVPNCGTETVNFASVFRRGIFFDGWSLDPSAGPSGTTGIAIEMGMKQAVRWVDGNNTPLVTMFSDALGGMQLYGAGLALTNFADAAQNLTLLSGVSAGQLSTVRFVDRGLPWWDVGKNGTNTFIVRNVQTGNIDLQFDTTDTLTLPHLGSVAAGTGKRFLCIDTATKIVYEGSGASCN